MRRCRKKKRMLTWKERMSDDRSHLPAAACLLRIRLACAVTCL